jgi:hypothetical protein
VIPYVEPGGSWRPFWLVATFLAVLIAADVLLGGPDVPTVVWLLSVVFVLGTVGGGAVSAHRVWTVHVDGDGPDAALSVGRERVPLADVDADHLRAVRDGTAGVDAGAPVLGGGWSLPKGRTGLPLRLTDGRTVLVPSRDPAALATALLAGVATSPESGPTDGSSGSQGTLGP